MGVWGIRPFYTLIGMFSRVSRWSAVQRRDPARQGDMPSRWRRYGAPLIKYRRRREIPPRVTGGGGYGFAESHYARGANLSGDIHSRRSARFPGTTGASGGQQGCWGALSRRPIKIPTGIMRSSDNDFGRIERLTPKPDRSSWSPSFWARVGRNTGPPPNESGPTISISHRRTNCICFADR